MSICRVWVNSAASTSIVRVEGTERSRWLIDRLSRLFVFKSSKPIQQEQNSLFCTFEVNLGSLSRSSFERMLATIPDVQLMGALP
jgi:hypothetical protein